MCCVQNMVSDGVCYVQNMLSDGVCCVQNMVRVCVLYAEHVE